MHLFYLHGFASSARSSKARFFEAKLAPLGIPLHCPDFNEPDFSTLTVSRMMGQLDEAVAALPPAPVAFIGSSLGAFVAWHTTARLSSSGKVEPAHPVSKLVLLAPALDFGANRMSQLGEAGLERWKANYWQHFFHHGYGEMRKVHFDLYTDARQYDSTRVSIRVPTLVFQGQRDGSVDPHMVRRFVAERPMMTLEELDDDHQLLGSLERIWTRTAQFLGL
jgi:pimeloyl-ACP methyl ester carboxylesterase